MEKVRIIYEFNVFSELEKGKLVFVLDRLIAEVFVVSKLMVCDALKLINEAKKDSTRYSFWVVEEQEEKGND